MCLPGGIRFVTPMGKCHVGKASVLLIICFKLGRLWSVCVFFKAGVNVTPELLECRVFFCHS